MGAAVKRWTSPACTLPTRTPLPPRSTPRMAAGRGFRLGAEAGAGAAGGSEAWVTGGTSLFWGNWTTLGARYVPPGANRLAKSFYCDTILFHTVSSYVA